MATTSKAAACADTADVVLLAEHAGVLHVLLVQRADDSDAYPGCWALPGGYVEPGEASEQAARRELTEETGVEAPAVLRYVGRFDKPGRDPRGPVASDAYVGTLPELVQPTADDDAKAARWVPIDELLGRPDLAFDHDHILLTALVIASAQRETS